MTDVHLLRTCVMCGTRAARPRVGTLGESKPGLWCSQCGHTWEPAKVPPINLHVWPSVSDVADLVHTHVTKHIAAVTPLQRLKQETGEELDILAATWLGRIRDHNPDGTFENDDQFRTRLLKDLGAI